MLIANAPAIDADQLRLRHEFLSMPGLVLTVAQTARLLGIRRVTAEQLLVSLEADGFLRRAGVETYCRTELLVR
jgi:DNA-binding IclR family transcriptional regulator